MVTRHDTTTPPLFPIVREDFAGAGGMLLGLRLAGYDGRLVGVEADEDAVATARAAGFEIVQGDVRGIAPDALGPLLGYTAGPPCQTFSAAGGRAGVPALASIVKAVELVADGYGPEEAIEQVHDSALDERSILVLHPLTVIRDARPRFVILEQVRPVLPVWQAYADALRSLGYTAHAAIHHAEQYGVPQVRERAGLVAVRGEHDPAALLAVPTHSRYYRHDRSRLDPGVEPWVTMATALGRGMTERPSMTVMGGGTATGGAEPFGNGARRGILRELEAGRWSPTSAVPGDTSWVDERPSPTVVGSYRPDVVAAPGYRRAGDPPRQRTPGSVRVTVEEAAALQSFPRGYPWSGSKGARYQQVGNAIPPLMACALAAPLLRAIRA